MRYTEGQPGEALPPPRPLEDLEAEAAYLRDNYTLDEIDLARRAISVSAEYADLKAYTKNFEPGHREAANELTMHANFGWPSRRWQNRKAPYSDNQAVDLATKVSGEGLQELYWSTTSGGIPIEKGSHQSDTYFIGVVRKSPLSDDLKGLIILEKHVAGVRRYLKERLNSLLELTPASPAVTRLRDKAAQWEWWQQEIYGVPPSKDEAVSGSPETFTQPGLSDILAYHKHVDKLAHQAFALHVGPDQAETYRSFAQALIYMRTSAIDNSRDTASGYFSPVLEALHTGDETVIRDTYDVIMDANPFLLTDYSYRELGYNLEEIHAWQETYLAEKEAQRAARAQPGTLTLYRRHIEAVQNDEGLPERLLRQYAGYVLHKLIDNVPRPRRPNHLLLLPVIVEGSWGPRFRMQPLNIDTDSQIIYAGRKISTNPFALWADTELGIYAPGEESTEALLRTLGYWDHLQALKSGGPPTIEQPKI